MLKSKQYETIIEELAKQNNEPEWLVKKRLASLYLFREKPMPSFVYGLNINLNIDLDLNALDPVKGASIAQKITQQDAIVQKLPSTIKDDENTFKEKFMTVCVPAQDKFTAFHNAFVNNVTVIRIPKNTEIKEPIEIESKIQGPVAFDHTIIIAEPNSKASVVEHLVSENDDGSYYSKIVEIFTEENAKLDYGSLQELNKKTFQFTVKRAISKKDSLVNWLDCCFGSDVTLSEVTTCLNEPGAESNNYGIFFGNGKQQFDIVTNSIHNAPNTVSDIFMKGALKEQSKCLYRGLVKINKEAASSNGYQQQDTLLLSPEAAADSIPNLEIENSDVKCSHGATIGKIDAEKLFYLQSRGLSRGEATREYVKGFFEPLIQKMKIAKLRDNMHDLVAERMQ